MHKGEFGNFGIIIEGSLQKYHNIMSLRTTVTNKIENDGFCIWMDVNEWTLKDLFRMRMKLRRSQFNLVDQE